MLVVELIRNGLMSVAFQENNRFCHSELGRSFKNKMRMGAFSEEYVHN